MIVNIAKEHNSLYYKSRRYNDNMIYMSIRSTKQMRHKFTVILINDNSGCYKYRKQIVVDPSLADLSYHTAAKFKSLSNISNHIHDIKRITIQQQCCDETEDCEC